MTPSNSNLKDRLIDVFARYNADEIQADNGKPLTEALGASGYPQLASDKDFQKYFNILRALRDQLDDRVEDHENMQQVKSCLSLLHEKKETNPGEEFEICGRLIKKRFYAPRWNESEKEYYDQGYRMIAEWKDYFLSYTNRNLCDTNDDFKQQIRGVFGATYFRENKERMNCLAPLIVHYLSNIENLTAFFDRDNLKSGDILESEILKYCTSVYAFVQLIEPVSFQYQEGKTNWCHREFETFEKWIHNTGLNHYKRYHFILTENEVFIKVIPAGYENWKQRIKERIHIPDLSSLTKKQIRYKLQEVAGEIVETKKQILEDYYL
jgi:hypothetical protein